MSVPNADCLQMLARFCVCSWSNWVRSVRIELTTSHALTSRSVCTTDSRVAAAAAAAVAVAAAAAVAVAVATAGAAVASRTWPALVSWRRMSCCTSGVTSSSIVWPWPMPRMRKAPWARSRKTMSLPSVSAAFAVSECLMSMPVVWIWS